MSERRSKEATEQEASAGIVVGESDAFAADSEEKTDPEIGLPTEALLAAFEAEAAAGDATEEPASDAEALAVEPEPPDEAASEAPELPVEALAVEPELPAEADSDEPELPAEALEAEPERPTDGLAEAPDLPLEALTTSTERSLPSLPIDAVESPTAASDAPAVPETGEAAQPFFFAPPAADAAAGPVADLGTLSLPSPSSRRRSRQDMSSMLQEFSVMFRVDDRSRKRKSALWTTLLVLLLAGVGGGILYVASRAPDADQIDLSTPLTDAVPPHAEPTEYLLLDRSQTPPRSQRKRVSALAGRLAQLAAVRALRAQGAAGNVQ